jgi:hypothetical protein
MKLHELKIISCFSDAIYKGNKTFELRWNDRDYRIGDHVQFSNIDIKTMMPKHHPINDCKYEITYIFDSRGKVLPNDYIIFSIRRVVS